MNAAALVVSPTITAAKISMLFFYREVFVTRRSRIANSVVLGLAVAWLLTFEFLFAFRCTPLAATYSITEQVEPTTKCVSYGGAIFAQEITNIFVDLLILALPLRELSALQMRLAKKLGLALVFALGALFVYLPVDPYYV